MGRKLSEAQLWLVAYLNEKWPHRTIVSEYKFHAMRRWRFDVAMMDYEQGGFWAFEIEGGLFSRSAGRHNRGAGMRADMEKYNTATAMGYKVFRFTPEQILKGEAKKFIEGWL